MLTVTLSRDFYRPALRLQKCHCDATERGRGEKLIHRSRAAAAAAADYNGKRDQCRHRRRAV